MDAAFKRLLISVSILVAIREGREAGEGASTP